MSLHDRVFVDSLDEIIGSMAVGAALGAGAHAIYKRFRDKKVNKAFDVHKHIFGEHPPEDQSHSETMQKLRDWHSQHMAPLGIR